MNITHVNASSNGYSTMPINRQAHQPSSDSTTKSTADNQQVSINTETQTGDQQYDLENITPQQTYKMAVELMENKTIEFDSFVKLMAIGLNQELGHGELQNANRSKKPFNLRQELDDISTGQHQYFKSGTAENREQASNLLAILQELPLALNQTEKQAINLQV